MYKIDLEDGTLSAVKTFLSALSHFVSPHTQRVGCQSISNLLGGGIPECGEFKRVLCIVLKKSNRYGFIFERAAWQFQLLAEMSTCTLKEEVRQSTHLQNCKSQHFHIQKTPDFLWIKLRLFSVNVKAKRTFLVVNKVRIYRAPKGTFAQIKKTPCFWLMPLFTSFLF